ncbi:hypothetical protein LN650_29600 [Klebsiella pneumoniae subsp. pneumoniae]|nr:hypothetical protein [Klebsiella pneumoniae subsp. pneumoniae]
MSSSIRVSPPRSSEFSSSVLRAQLRLQDLVLLAGQRFAVGLADLPQLRLPQQIFKAQTLHAQLRHFRIQLLRARALRQPRHLGAQGFAQQIGGAQPLRLLAQSV